MPKRIVPSETERQPKGCLIATAVVFIAFIGLLVYAAIMLLS